MTLLAKYMSIVKNLGACLEPSEETGIEIKALRTGAERGEDDKLRVFENKMFK
jgi:hypothetical protein